MSAPLQVIKSINMTDAILSGTSLSEADYPAWAAGTTYEVGGRVIRLALHKVYESVIAGNVGNTPETSPDKWIEVGATNRWRLFDLSTTSQTQVDAADYYEITPGQAVNAMALVNISGILSVQVRLTDPSFGLVYDKTADLVQVPNESSWYAWFFEPRTQQTQFVVNDLPSYPNATLRFDVTSSGAAYIGALVFGSMRTVGTLVRSGVRLSIQDYSRKERNDFGDTVLVQRAFASRVAADLVIDNKELDNTFTLLSQLRATPCLWVVADGYNSLSIFGFYNNFDINISYPAHSDCTIDIEGLA